MWVLLRLLTLLFSIVFLYTRANLSQLWFNPYKCLLRIIVSLLPCQSLKSGLPVSYIKMRTKVSLDNLFAYNCSFHPTCFCQKHFYQIICLLKNVLVLCRQLTKPKTPCPTWEALQVRYYPSALDKRKPLCQGFWIRNINTILTTLRIITLSFTDKGTNI